MLPTSAGVEPATSWSPVGQCIQLSHRGWLRIYSASANSVDPDQLASEANWSGSALFAIKYVNLYQEPGSSNLIAWKWEVGVTSQFIHQDKG